MSVKLKGTKVQSWSELKKGDKFFVVQAESGHNYPLNTVLTMKKNGEGCGGSNHDIACEKRGGNHINLSNIRRLDITTDIPEMKKRAKELKSELEILTAKIQFCEENGCEKFDEDEFAIYHALDVLDGVGTRQEKAKALAQLLKQKK